MKEVKTLVYFDLEATGLKSSGKPRITEISLVAVNFEDVLELQGTLVNHLKNKTNRHVDSLVPRVINKLTLCVYPMAPILPVVTNITGLDNYNLTNQARFDRNTLDLLNNFLARLPAPVCLVAHNGDQYDFPLLKAELVKVGGGLGAHILCVDSYVGIREIFNSRLTEEVRVDKNINIEIEKTLIDKEMEAVIELLAAGEFESEMVEDDCGARDNVTENKLAGKRFRKDVESLPDVFRKSKITKLENELTPARSNSPAVMSQNPSRAMLKQLSCTAMFKTRKKLNFSTSASPPSFSLINLHKYLLGSPPAQSHGAEADCLALLRTTAMLGKEWLDWVQENCYVLMDCRGLWGVGK